MQVLNYGGGWQTTAMLVLIEQGKLERPDRIVIADTGREKSSTWHYLENVARPKMEAIGLAIEVAPHSLATVDIYSKKGVLLLPVYTPTGKLSAYCSGEWKQAVIDRYLRQSGAPTERNRTHWIGFAFDERHRVKGTDGRRFPLIEMMLTKEDNRNTVRNSGWPLPTASMCWMCANMSNAQWREIRDNNPVDFEQACQIDEDVRETNLLECGLPVWLHHSRVPLREADLEVEDRKEPSRQCGLGLCFV